jgi:hypothetical protein
MVISLKVNRDDDNFRSCLYVNLAGSHMIEPGPKVLFLTISSAKSAPRNVIVIVIVAYFRLHQLSAIAQDMRVRAFNFPVSRLFAFVESFVRDDGANFMRPCRFMHGQRSETQRSTALASSFVGYDELDSQIW